MADLIGSWNPSNCIIGIFPENLKLARDNTDNEHVNLENFNTQNMPMFQGESAGAFKTLTPSGFSTNYWYNDGVLKFDGTDDYAQTNLPITFTDTNKYTFEFRIDRTNGTREDVSGIFDDDANWFGCLIMDTNKLIFNIKVATNIVKAESSTTITEGIHTVTYEKDGATLKIYIDGVEVSYTSQTSYNLGDKTYTNNLKIGTAYSSSYPYLGSLYSVRIYNDAIGATRILTNYNLGSAMGLTVNDRQLNEILTVKENSRSIGTYTTTETGLSGVIDATGWEITMTGNARWGVGDEISIDGEIRYVYSRVGNVFRLQNKTTKTGTQTCSIKRFKNSLADWETSIEGVLTISNKIEKGICFKDGDLANVKIDVSTADITRFIWLTADKNNRHNGIFGNGVKIISPSGRISGVYLAVNYTVVEWIEVAQPDNYKNTGFSLTGATNLTISKCIVSGGGKGFYAGSTSNSNIIHINNCVSKGVTSGPRGFGFACAENTNIRSSEYLYNNLAIDCNTGFLLNYGSSGSPASTHIRNCISLNSLVTDDFDLINATTLDMDYCLSSDNTAMGLHSFKNILKEDTIISDTDFNLLTGSVAIGSGIDISNVETDIAGVLREVPWDMGVFKFISTGGGGGGNTYIVEINGVEYTVVKTSKNGSQRFLITVNNEDNNLQIFKESFEDEIPVIT